MTLDINLFRVHQGGDPELIKESQRRRFAPPEAVDKVIELDAQWRDAINAADALRRERNNIQKQVSQKKKAKEPCDDQIGRAHV